MTATSSDGWLASDRAYMTPLRSRPERELGAGRITVGEYLVHVREHIDADISHVPSEVVAEQRRLDRFLTWFTVGGVAFLFLMAVAYFVVGAVSLAAHSRLGWLSIGTGAVVGVIAAYCAIVLARRESAGGATSS